MVVLIVAVVSGVCLCSCGGGGWCRLVPNDKSRVFQRQKRLFGSRRMLSLS
jgi:hypothetical protein